MYAAGLSLASLITSEPEPKKCQFPDCKRPPAGSRHNGQWCRFHERRKAANQPLDLPPRTEPEAWRLYWEEKLLWAVSAYLDTPAEATNEAWARAREGALQTAREAVVLTMTETQFRTLRERHRITPPRELERDRERKRRQRAP